MKRVLLPNEFLMKHLKQSSIRKVQIWLWLKFRCDGHMDFHARIYSDIGNALGFSSRTAKRFIQALIESNWVGFNPQSNVIYIRSIHTVLKIEEISNGQAHWFFEKNLLQLKQFAFASGVSEILRQKKNKEWRRSKRIGRHFKSSPLPLSVSYISQRYSFSPKFVKGLLKSNPFLKIRKSTVPYLINGEIATPKDLPYLKKYGKFKFYRLTKAGEVFISGPNLISSKIKSKKRSVSN